MKITAEPRSDQWNADDFVGSPRTFTIAGVQVGKAEQKYDIELVEGQGRAWRPPLTMLRLLIAAWGDEAATWVGRKVTLYRDPSVRFGSDQVGGIRVSHMSDLPGGKPFEVMLTSTRGRRTKVRVEPLRETAPTQQPAPSAPAVSDETLADLVHTFNTKGIPEDKWVEWASWAIKVHLRDLDALTDNQARAVLAELDKRPDAPAGDQ